MFPTARCPPHSKNDGRGRGVPRCEQVSNGGSGGEGGLGVGGASAAPEGWDPQFKFSRTRKRAIGDRPYRFE